MVAGIGNFSSSYFSPFIKNKANGNKSADSKALKGLKIASYFTLVIPLAVALVWGGSALAGRVSNFFSKSSATAKKADNIASQIISPNKPTKKDKVDVKTLFPLEDDYKLCLTMIVQVMKEVRGTTNLENNLDILFDADIVPMSKEDIKEAENFMKGIKLSEIQFENSETSSKFKIVNKENPSEFLEFSNRVSTKGEMRGEHLRNNLKRIRKEEGGADKTLYEAISELFKPGIDNTLFIYLKSAPFLSSSIEGDRLDALFSKCLEAQNRGEEVDEKKAEELLQEVYS